MWRSVDLVILGGGCAGLSLAYQLCKLGRDCPSTLVIEKRSSYSNDRTWCFWANQGSPVGDLVAHQWQQLLLANASQTLGFDCGANPYQMVQAADFYARAAQAIAQSPAAELAADTAVMGEPHRTASGWVIETARGTVQANMIVDARSTAFEQASAAVLWQSFYGQDIECSDDFFNPAQAVLMDFTPAAEGRIAFTYLLPTSPRRALIEATVFGPEPLDAADLADQLELAKVKHVGTPKHRVTRCESGVLPMGLTQRAPSLGHGHARAGIMAGAARPSSGFAFQRIQNWAALCCRSIASGHGPVGHAPDPLPMQLMDRLFLRVIRSAPEMAPALFLSIFKNADSQAVIRFLSGTARMGDYFQVVSALPAGRFVRQLLRPAPARRLADSAK